MEKFSHTLSTCIAAAIVAVLLAACVSNSNQPAQNKMAVASVGPMFYPPLPSSPRIQYLTTIAGERDLLAGEAKERTAFAQPYGIAMYRGKLYVPDSAAGGFGVFDPQQQHFNFVTGSGSGRIKRPISIRIDADGTKYVSDIGRDQILVYDRDDRFVTAFGGEGQFRPADVAIVGERLYVADLLHHQVQVLDKGSGRLLFQFAKAGSGAGELFSPTNIAQGPDGDIYVVDTRNFRVQRFTAAGKPVRTYGSVGSLPSNFAWPKGLAIDKAGRLLVGDAAFQNVKVFENDGKLLVNFGKSPGQAVGRLNLPAGLIIDYDNVAAFRRFADPKFNIEYLIFVASQFGANKVDIFGFGKIADMDDAAKPAS